MKVLVAVLAVVLTPIVGFFLMSINYKNQEVKEFADFSYITVEPSGWAILLTYIVTILANVGISVFAIKNEFT